MMILKKFLGVFPFGYVNRFIQFLVLMEQKSPYQFVIMNTERADEEGEHWSFLDLNPLKQ